MARRAGVLLALATAAAVLTVPTTTTALAPPVDLEALGAALPRETVHGIELTLAGGDRLRLRISRDGREVTSRRYDSASATWAPSRLVLREPHLFCGDLDARTSAGAVAVIAECERFGYAEDQAPTDSRALYSPDAVTWSSHRLAGESYEEPGISPDGTRAVWPEDGGYLTSGPEGFARHPLQTPGQEFTATATITDDAEVSYLYGVGPSSRCRLVALTRTGDATPTRQEITTPAPCGESDMVNLDASTVVVGYLPDPSEVAVVSRVATGSPWAVTRPAPRTAPGLLPAGKGLTTRFVAVPGVPLLALGSRTARRVRAQVYDPTTQSWGAPTTVLESARRCLWSGGSVLPLQVVAVELRCGGHHLVLTTRDGVAWQSLRMGPRATGRSRDGRYVAVPGPTSTSVISRELGVVSLPTGVGGRCDVAVPDGPDAAVQVVAGASSRGWPTRIRYVSASGTQALGRSAAPTAGRCAGVEQSYDRPTRFDMESTRPDHGQTLQVVRRGDGWVTRIDRW